MKYIVMTQQRNGSGDCFPHEFELLEEAVEFASRTWNKYLTPAERRINTVYVLESINPDEDAIEHYDGYTIWEDGKDVL